MLCSRYKRCIASVESRGTRTYELHNSLGALQAAAESSCYICSNIFEQLQAELENANLEDRRSDQCLLKVATWDDEEEDVWGVEITLCDSGSLQTKTSRWMYRLVPLLHDTDHFGFETQWLRSRGGRATHKLYPEIPSSTGSQETLGLARDWYCQCHRNHPECSPHKNFELTRGCKWYPPRLLDLSTPQPRLVTRDNMDDHQEYATLSHCWGPDTFTVLTDTRLASFQQDGIPVADLPQTFQDAVNVCRSMRIRYLWIDSLCIIQSGLGSWKDWADHVVRMCSIYGLSDLCIATAAASKATDPAFTLRNTQAVEPVWVFIRPADSDLSVKRTSHLVVPADLAICGYRTAPLASRAWALQERLLSPRILTFGKEQIFWECKWTEGHNYCETFPSGVLAPCYSRGPFALPDPIVNEFDWYHIWQALIDTYSECQLTRSNGDKFAAFAGIALITSVEFQRRRYIAGVFDFELPQALLWNVRVGAVPTSRPLPTAEVYRAPTWSWGASDAPISCWRQDLNDCYDTDQFIALACVISTCIIPLHSIDDRGFGPLRYAEITLEAPLIPFLDLTSLSGFGVGERDLDETQTTLYLDARDEEGYMKHSFFMPILIIGANLIEGLIVCCAELPLEYEQYTAAGSHQFYRRLGVAIVDNHLVAAGLKDIEKRVLTLI